MPEGCRKLPEHKGISGFGPACWGPEKGFAALAFGLLLITAAPAEETRSEPAASGASSSTESGRYDGESAPPKDVRPALTRRKRNALSQFDGKATPFDPKVFEARGRELHGQYYEISGAVNPTPWTASGSGQAPAGNTAGIRKDGSRNWMIWTGAAGLAAIVGGSVGYLMLSKHTAQDPLSIHLDDKP